MRASIRREDRRGSACRMSRFSEWLLGESVKETAEYLDIVVPDPKKKMVQDGLMRLATIFFLVGLVGGLIFGASMMALGMKMAGMLS